MKLKPNKTLLVTEPLEVLDEQKTESGLILKSQSLTDTRLLKVLVVGKDVDKKYVSAGDSIISNGGVPIVVDGKTYIIVKDEQIVVVI